MPSTRTQQALAKLADLTPRQIAAELDRYTVGQADATKVIALRNRWRRQRAPESIREEISPTDHLLARAQRVAKVRVVRDPMEAVKGAHVINTDVWASMGQEQEQKERERAFHDFSVTSDLMRAADKNAIFLHCLPAHRGEEVAAEVIDGPQSRVWDEAKNRLHIQKAIMAVRMGGEAL